ncbi:MAG TPA: dethiobiotin synthase [Polyangiaceae bacterium]
MSNDASADTVRVLVVLGTGTAVGKTWVSVGLARALRQLGAFVMALKPIESGIATTILGLESDAGQLATASSALPGDPPYRLAEAVSPHLAARRASVTVSLGAALTYVRDHIAISADFAPACVIVETAGGLLSPLSDGVTNWDFARGLEPASWVLVAPDSLGVLHDLSATLEVMKGRGRSPDHVVLSAARQPDASTGTNASELAHLGIATVSGCFSRDDESAFTDLARAVLGPG